jgi:phosphatidylinositol alpha-1,6-mannosyltransferase
MRALLVTSTFPRWAGDDTTPFVLRFAKELMKAGLDIDVLAPHAPGAKLSEEIEGVSVERFRYVRPEAAEDICYSGGALFNLKGSPVRTAKLPLLIGAQWAAIRARTRSGRYDVVSAHWLLPQGWTAVRASRANTPVVSTVHGSDVFALRQAALRSFKRSALRNSAAVTVNSSATRDAVALLDPDLPDVRLIPMGTDVSARARPELVEQWRDLSTGDGPLVAYVGRLVDWKGVDDLLAAAVLAAEDLPYLSVVIAGTGPLQQHLEARALSLGLGDRVHFVGWLTDVQVTALQAAADVVAIPSRTSRDGSREAQGLSVIEAMALGKPVVAGRVGGIPDAVEDGKTGLLVPERSPDALANALRLLISDQELSAKIGAAARKSVQRYAWPAVAGRFVELFQDVVSRARR